MPESLRNTLLQAGFRWVQAHTLHLVGSDLLLLTGLRIAGRLTGWTTAGMASAQGLSGDRYGLPKIASALPYRALIVSAVG